MTIIIFCYGENYYKYYLSACLQSILDIYGDTVNIILNISKVSNSSINYIKKKIPWVKIINGMVIDDKSHEDMAAQKIKKGWLTSIKSIKNGQRILFIDADTVLIKNIDNFFNTEFDIGYTYYENHLTPYGDSTFTSNGYNRINTGVLLVKYSSNVKRFLVEYANKTNYFLNNESPFKKEFGAFDQDAFAWFLCNGDLNHLSHPINHYNGLRFYGFTCKELNECESVPISDKTHIIHYKGGWRNIIPHGKWNKIKSVRNKSNSQEQYNIWLKYYQKWNDNNIIDKIIKNRQIIKHVFNLRNFKYKLISYFKKTLVKIEKSDSRFNKYADYVNHQLEKTKDEKRINLWLNEEWDIKYQGFIEIFNRNRKYIFHCKNALCLGSRTGQEVKALIDIGINAIGVDLKEFPPYTQKGDIHDLRYSSGSFDFVFSNIVDHSLYPEKMMAEIERVVAKDGIVILHLQIVNAHDEYTVTKVYNENIIINFFKNLKLLSSKKIKNKHDLMNHELIFKK